MNPPGGRVTGPVIGIVGPSYVVPRLWGELTVAGVPKTYVDAVAAAGGRPVILPVSAVAGELVGTVDGLVLAGGGDLDPSLYGAGGPARDLDRERDVVEIRVAREARRDGVPLLGVCRGAQVMAVAFGGTLAPDLGMSHVRPGDRHMVATRPGSVLAGLIGPRPTVNSLHDQAVLETGGCWTSVAAADDGVVEAIEWTGDGAWPAIGVQWHPELAPEDVATRALFGWLVEAATRSAAPARRSRGRRAGAARLTAGAG